MDDFELLKEYSEQGSQPAFRQLVERQVDLVYSAARRQVRSPELAQEVTQSVFVELALQARKLRPGQPLAAWLHVVTRRRAIDALRHESRRRQRELTAVQIAAVATPPSDWTGIEPLLDEAIASLDQADRSAVVLRFFENRSLREVGRALGGSEDAAQKRVSRALNRLREFLGRRGIATTAGGLAAVISAHAVEAAPAGLAAAIFPATVAVPAALGPPSLGPQLLMTSTQKVLIAAGLVAGVGTIWLQQRVIDRQERQIAVLGTEAEGLHAEIHRLSARLTQASARLAKSQDGLSSDKTPEVISPELRKMLSRIGVLKQRLERDPSQRTPEMSYLSDADWIYEAAHDDKLETDEDFRKALSRLRSAASARFLEIVQGALGAYLKVSQGQLPSNLADLAPYAAKPMDNAALARYQILETGSTPKSENIVSQIPDTVVDQDYDTITRIGVTSMSTTNVLGDAVQTARAAYLKANNGVRPQDPGQLAPYFANPNLAKKYLDRLQHQ